MEAAIRFAVTQSLRRNLVPGKPSEKQWKYLTEHQHVAKAERGELSISGLAALVRLIFEAQGFTDELSDLYQQRLRGEWPPSREWLRMTGITENYEPDFVAPSHLDAVAALLVRRAAAESRVQNFRDATLERTGQYLKALAPSKIDEWVTCQARADGPYTVWARVSARSQDLSMTRDGQITLPLSVPSTVREFALTGPSDTDDITLHWLDYSVPGEGFPRSEPVAAGGRLDELRMLSSWLAHRYGWKRFQATNFILTGVAPRIDPIEPDIDLRLPYQAMTRISLSVMPFTAPRELEEPYRKAREHVFGLRQRDLSEKHQYLAVFSARHRPEHTWEAILGQWNQTYPDWAYGEADIPNFARDCLQAQRRLLGETKP